LKVSKFFGCRYENGAEPLTVLAARYGVSRSTFLTRAKERGWVRKHAR